ncbi:phosphonate metabolism transcriptional regulator PhnF [Derxia lacustris]|uniref:phosphonate metabolism transcriptional regulator PhnF n=1 Tax=Derxia lacustris TaxID=764842 RepID=UPI001592DD97|nr:phosphonate metabolism transcriptional regulator PhnF [Derxia lacustris]
MPRTTLAPASSTVPPAAPVETPAAPRRWEAIAAALRDDIAAGRFAPGARLPNESALAERFGVNRHTLRQAMQALAREGFVKVLHGSGTYVRELVLDYALRRRTRLTDSLAGIGERARRELLDCAIEPAGDWARALGVGARTTVEILRTRASVRGRPIGISTAAFPCPRLAGMAEAFAAAGSITGALARLGVADYTRQRSSIACRLPTQAEADALARPAAQPVLVVSYTNVDAAGVAVEAGITLFAADAVQLTVEADAPDADAA